MNGPATSSPSPGVEAIGWMLVHSLWQGAGVAMALGLVLCVLRRAPARSGYLAACAAMTLMVALPIATFRRPDVRHPGHRVLHEATAESAPGAGVTPIPPDFLPTRRPEGLRVAERLEPVLPAIVALWMAGVGVFSLRLLGGWIQARRWVRNHTRPMDDPWPGRVERLKERLGIRRAVALLESARVEVPMVVGWLRPAILVPVAALSGLSVPELEAILAHELAHVRRHDYLVNLIQCLVEVLVFYHPATWWISRVIRREREVCCDDLAVAICRDRVAYARALAAMEGLRVPAFSPSPAANGGILLARVRRILNPQEESMKPVRILAGLAVVLAAAPLWLARAGDDPPAPPATAPSPALSFLGQYYANLFNQVEEAPTGRSMIAVGSQPAGIPRVGDARGGRREIRARKDRDDGFIAFLHDYTIGQVAPVPPPAGPDPRRQAATLVQETAGASPEDCNTCLDPPGEAEVLAKISGSGKGPRPFYETRRDNVRVLVEKFAAKVDPVKVYPLAGPCQLVHCHYKCTVYYDEVSWSDHPIPFKHLDRRVEVVYIDKDHLRRAPTTQAPAVDPVDDRIDRLSREIEELRSTRRRDRREQERILDRLIGELEGLRRELRDDAKGIRGAK